MFGSAASIAMDHANCVTIIQHLLGPTAINAEKTEGPASTLEAIGWQVNMVTGMFYPSKKVLCKLFYYTMRGISLSHRSVRVTLHEASISVLELVAVVIAIVENSAILRNGTVCIFVAAPVPSIG